MPSADTKDRTVNVNNKGDSNLILTPFARAYRRGQSFQGTLEGPQ